jgi:hypothetical protein
MINNGGFLPIAKKIGHPSFFLVMTVDAILWPRNNSFMHWQWPVTDKD